MVTATVPAHAIAVLMELTRDLTRQGPLEEALQAVTDAALELLPADHASIRVLDESRTELLCGARSGAGEPHRPGSFRPGQGVVGWVVEHQTPARIADTARDERFDASTPAGWALRSLLVVPLWSADRVVGALGASSPSANAFSSDDEVMALLLANCAAPPIERVRLERLSITDPLTLAYNERYLKERMLEEMDRARRYGSSLTLAALALDDWETADEPWGAADHDRVLRQLADRLRTAVRRADALVRRDDEFLLVMPHTDAEQALLVCERIRKSLLDYPIVLDSKRVEQTLSGAVVQWQEPLSARRWEEGATRGRGQARAEGGNRVIVVGGTPSRPPTPPPSQR